MPSTPCNISYLHTSNLRLRRPIRLPREIITNIPKTPRRLPIQLTPQHPIHAHLRLRRPLPRHLQRDIEHPLWLSNSINNSPSLSQLACHYIAVKFKRLYSSLTDKKLYVSMAKGLQPDSVDDVIKYAREILKWDEERHNFSLSDYSMYSMETSSFTH